MGASQTVIFHPFVLWCWCPTSAALLGWELQDTLSRTPGRGAGLQNGDCSHCQASVGTLPCGQQSQDELEGQEETFCSFLWFVAEVGEEIGVCVEIVSDWLHLLCGGGIFLSVTLIWLHYFRYRASLHKEAVCFFYDVRSNIQQTVLFTHTHTKVKVGPWKHKSRLPSCGLAWCVNLPCPKWTFSLSQQALGWIWNNKEKPACLVGGMIFLGGGRVDYRELQTFCQIKC